MGEIVGFFQGSSQSNVEAISVLLVDDQPVFRNVARSGFCQNSELILVFCH